MSRCDSQIPIVPASGFLDARSTVDAVPFGGYRRAVNVDLTTKLRLCRAKGYAKFGFEDEEFNNQDLHDQLVAADKAQDIILLHQATTTAGFTHLFAGTQHRLYARVGSGGNWRLIGDGFGGPTQEGCPDLAWFAASTGSITVFSNNLDPPQYHIAGQPPLSGGNAMQPVRDLERLNVTKAGVVVAWKNLTLLMDVEQDGVRVRNRIIWSDYKRPLSYYPNRGISLAGTSDLPSGEIILNAKAMADVLLIYTTTGIWDCVVSGTDSVLTFRKRYVSDEAGSRCLAYRRTLVSIGDEHYYMGSDGIYRYSLYVQRPELVEYIHRASAVVFDDINAAACNAHCGGFFPERRQVWFSWAKAGEDCAQNTLVVGTEFPFCSVFDAGFSAYVNAEPRVNRIIRDVFRDLCICTSAELAGTAFALSNEGGPCKAKADPACENRPTSFWTVNPREEADLGVTTEDWTQSEPDPGSFGGLYPTLTVGELCNSEFLAGDCNPNEVFVMASTRDRCLKEAANVYYREHLTDGTGCGTYSKDGYRSRLTSGALHFNAPEFEKVASCFQIEAHPEPATLPGEITFRIGVAAQAIDPLTASGRCLIFWEEQEPKRLECQNQATLEESRREGTAPAETFAWPLYAPGRYLYYDIEIGNSRATPKDTGAAVCISRYDLTARQAAKCQ